MSGPVFCKDCKHLASDENFEAIKYCMATGHTDPVTGEHVVDAINPRKRNRELSCKLFVPRPPPSPKTPWRCRLFGHAWRKATVFEAALAPRNADGGGLALYCARCPMKSYWPPPPPAT